MGVVVNRPSDIPLRKTLPELSEARRLETPVYWGGPVQPEAILALIRSPRSGTGARMVVPEVYLTADLDVLRTALTEPRPDRAVRVYSGYAGWSPGQLAGEYRRGDWILDRADASSVFAPDPSYLWERVRALMERREARDRQTIVPARGRTRATILL